MCPRILNVKIAKKVEDIVISDYCFSEFLGKDMDPHIIEYYIFVR